MQIESGIIMPEANYMIGKHDRCPDPIKENQVGYCKYGYSKMARTKHCNSIA